MKTSIPLAAYSPRLAVLAREYPKSFRSQALSVRGDVATLLPEAASFSVAIIGSRRPTAYGLRFVEDFVRFVAPLGWSIVSGGALGIDGHAHRCALTSGLPTRAWVVGSVEDPSPRSHARLFDEIGGRKGSALLCPQHLELEAGLRAESWAWLDRNAWVAGDAQAVVVVEAQVKSGTWSTAKMAADMGIPVYALPGSVFSEVSQGTNQMIAEGYALPIGGVRELTESLVVHALPRSYNIERGSTAES
jgi:DNA processing protein